MDYLAEHKLVRRHTRTDLVRNELVLAGHEPAADSDSVIDRSFPLALVVGQGPLAMCNPADHPAGRYGKAALESLGLWDQVAARIAIVDNPQVAVTMVARGDAPAERLLQHLCSPEVRLLFKQAGYQ
jgi:molybdate transport system substrate-binding protein